MFIKIRGARHQNLKSINVEILKNAITVVTGPSGSGKTSFAVHTVYAEAQRRYLECLGNSVRPATKQLEKPDVDSIDGLSPAILVSQDRGRINRQATVATMTEVYDYIRLLYASVGVPHDPRTGELLEKLTSAEVVARLCLLPEGTKVIVLSPLKVDLWSDLDELKDDLRRQGFIRVRVDGVFYELEDEWPLKMIRLEVVIDRLVIRVGIDSRIADSVETSLRISAHETIATVLKKGESEWSDLSFSTSYRNPKTGFILGELSPQSFSFQSHLGRCERCLGKGTIDGQLCEECGGGRLKPEYLSVLLPTGSEMMGIRELCALTIQDVSKRFQMVDISDSRKEIVDDLIDQIQRRLGFLDEIGLSYLKLNRSIAHLSSGEFQRLRLATQLGAGLSGVLYVLDEPSTGLHRSDTQNLISSLIKLRDQGNTLIVVEHDREIIEAADEIIDFGPEAGEQGGYLLAKGTVAELKKSSTSPTGQWLRERDTQGNTTQHIEPGQKAALKIVNARTHNLDRLTVGIPLNSLVAITGVSGSGKSSLIHHTLFCVLNHTLNGGEQHDCLVDEIHGSDQLSRVVMVDQAPIGKTARSSPATFTGAFDLIRQLFATLPLSKQRGYTSSRFSSNVKGGRCEKCLGAGSVRIDLQFLNDAYVVCDACGGRRYNRETLEVLFKGRSIADVLDDSIEKNQKHFQSIPKLNRILQSLISVGLGYLKLGQIATTLSGGEAQRVKIASELAKLSRHDGSNLYILDEPTSGLYFSDVEVLLGALRQLVSEGHSVIVIEHNEHFVSAADWQIALGPGAGNQGGMLLYEGVPKGMSNCV